MMCPLIRGLVDNGHGGFTVGQADCLKDECAWYVKGLEECSITVLTRQAVIGLGMLGEILPKKTTKKEG